MEEIKKQRLTKYGLEQMIVDEKRLHRCRATDRDRVIGSLKTLFRNHPGKSFEVWPVKIGVEYKRVS